MLLKLPRSIVKRVNEMLVEIGPERKTYEEIADWVKAEGHRTSKSAIDRYAKYFFSLEKVKILSEQAKVIIQEAGEGSPLGLEEATSKLGTVVVMELLQETMKSDGVDAKRIGQLLHDFAKLQSSSVQRERLKMDFRKKVERELSKMKKDYKAKPGAQGLSDELVEEIKRRILGVS